MAKVYDTATDIITFARGSSATYTGSDGTQQTAASDEPRIEYAADGTLKGLLIEEQRTNLLLNSDNPDTQVASLAAGSHTLSFVGGPSVTGISDSIDDNAVDVFVYDTSKDSDGGAWRTGSLAQASSWYAEASSPTRDPETRSTRAEFPAVAVIVAESNKVTIYDGDDPSLPMWMVFNRPTSFITTLLWPWSTVTATAIAALNGTLAFASTGSSRFKTVNFIDEVSYQWGLTQSYKGNVPISERDTSWTNTVPITGTVVSTELNDVAMTVLPNAPTDPATGLKVPTIAVATEGGVSVIKDDGTVVDITSNFGSTYSVCKSVSFSSANDLKFLMGYSGYTSFFTKPIPASDQTVITVQSDPTDKDFMWGGYNLPAILFGGNAVTARLDNYFADELGLTIGSEADTPSKNMVAYTTSDYTTGWMPGDIKLAALADTTAETLSGSELVVDGSGNWVGDFDVAADVSEWTAINNAVITHQAASGRMRVTNGATGRAGAEKTITTTVGKHYRVTFDGIAGTSPAVFLYVGTASNNSNVANIVNVNGTGLSLDFVAESTTTYLQFLPSFTTNGVYVEFDNISVRLADPDRSVNGNGLGVHGSITKAPVATGADVVAYSGFSASNYLEQPYNPDLDFGQGDFCVMGWIEYSGANQRTILVRENASGSYAINLKASSLGISFTVSGGDQGVTTPSGSLPVGTWSHVCAMRVSGVLYVYINGALSNSGSGANSVTLANALLHFGWYYPPSPQAFGDPLALWRISATAPTAEQIAKIYEDERPLFQPNAKATLTGTSDAVTALAHDPDTNLLHVGTSGGRSVFYGLRRVNETATAVTTAISAVDGLIVEQ